MGNLSSVDVPGLPETQTPGRRSIVKGAAWSVPVLSVGWAAPAIATSNCDEPGQASVEAVSQNTAMRLGVRNVVIPACARTVKFTVRGGGGGGSGARGGAGALLTGTFDDTL